MTGMKRARLSAIALGMAVGVLCGGWMLAAGLMAYDGGSVWATDMVHRWAAIFPGVQVSLAGSFVLAAWGFLKGLLSGLILGWIYNLCLCCCSKCCPCCKCPSCDGRSCSISKTDPL